MKKQLVIALILFSLISCQTEKEKQLNKESTAKFENSVLKIKKSLYDVNVDSFRIAFNKQKSENSELGFAFANRFEKYANQLLQKRDESDYEASQLQAIFRESDIKHREEQRKQWENSKYGKLQKKHPIWTDEECMKVINKKVWIGMSIEMLKYQRGNPDSSNPSNYGNGTEWQWCWTDFSPSCFYGKDGIITAFN